MWGISLVQDSKSLYATHFFFGFQRCHMKSAYLLQILLAPQIYFVTCFKQHDSFQHCFYLLEISLLLLAPFIIYSLLSHLIVYSRISRVACAASKSTGFHQILSLFVLSSKVKYVFLNIRDNVQAHLRWLNFWNFT